MDRYSRNNNLIIERNKGVLQTFISHVYGWMACGLILTAVVAWYAANTESVLIFIFSNRMVLIGLILAELALVIGLSGLIHKLSAAAATFMFMLYAALTGLTISSIFIVYTMESIASAFVVSGAMFAIMAVWGSTTKTDLTKLGNILFMALIGIILAIIVNFFLKSSALSFGISCLSVVIFAGLTAYDTQKLKEMGNHLSLDDSSTFRKYAILGGLNLYLDFINLFLSLLRIMGSRR